MPGIGGTNGSEPAATITFDAERDSTPASVRTSTAPGPVIRASPLMTRVPAASMRRTCPPSSG